MVPLFVAPPDVCAAARRTLLYGVVPVTSTELSAPTESLPAYDAADTASHLPQLLKAGLAPSLPAPGGYVRYSEVKTASPASALSKFVQQVRRVALELDAFGASPAARALRAELDRITLVFLDPARWPESRTSDGLEHFREVQAQNRRFGRSDQPAGILRVPLGSFLEDAARKLVAPDDESAAIRMPVEWPAIPAAAAQRIHDAARASMKAKLQSVVPKAGRFDDATRQYVLRAFVRVKGEQGCAPALVWSGYSEPFAIAPWYAPSDAPPAVIPLPDVLDRNALKALKPNVAFAVPKKLMDVLQGDPKDLMEGKGGGSSGVALDWICSFSLPIITLCAFIVLNIFLQLFDLIFRWLLFIKICIPIPRRR